MSDSPDFPDLSTAVIRAAAGYTAAYERGLDYQRGGRVDNVVWSSDRHRVTGSIRGSQRRTYHAEADFARDGRRVRLSDCSCPMGGGCKHVMALLLQARSDIAAGTAPVSQAATIAALRAQIPGVRAPLPPPVPEWQRMLAPLTSAPVPDAAEQTSDGLALQFRVEGIDGPAAGPFRGGDAGLSLSVRPVNESGKGWANGWPTPYAAYGDRSWNAAWLTDLAAARSNYYSYQTRQWCPLNAFSERLLWLLLAQGRRAGVEFVGTSAHHQVRLVDRAELELDIQRTGDGGLTVTRRLLVDGQPFPAQMVGLVGHGGVFGVQVDGRDQTIVFGPSPRPLVAAAEALSRLRQVTVAPPDVPTFLDGTYPLLRRRLTVVSSDGSVDLPAPRTPKLLAEVAFPDARTAVPTWAWGYGGLRRPFRFDSSDSLRDREAELAVLAAVADVLRAAGLAQPIGTERLTGLDALAFARAIPGLQAIEGVAVDVVGEIPDYREADEAPQIAVSVSDGDDADWFDLGVQVMIEGREVPFKPLFLAIARDEPWLILDDGTLVSTQLPQFTRLHELIEEARRLSDQPESLTLNRYAASLWGEFEDLADIVEQADRWRCSVDALARLDAGGAMPTPQPLPAGLHAQLRPYQVSGYEWLAFLWRYDLGGILADDMGLGKTVEVLALIAHAVEASADDAGPRHPFLVVAPASVVANWGAEAARFTPGLRVAVLSSTLGRAGVGLDELVDGADVVVTSYAIFRIDYEHFGQREWAGLILDEAQFLKNPKTRANECARLLRAPFKLAVTGTPMENNVMELWAILAVVAPGLFRSASHFRQDYVNPINAGVRARTTIRLAQSGGLHGYTAEDRELDERAQANADVVLARLRRRVRPLLLRRTKEQVAPELPERIEQVLSVELSGRHRRIYDTLLQRERQRVLGLLDDFQTNRFEIFRSLMLLRRAALDASLIDQKYAGVGSAKLDALFEQVDDLVTAGHRALVFSQFTTFLAVIGERAKANGLRYEYLDGRTRRRADVIARFRTGDAPLFLISLKAGGFGLNLTEADYVFLMDPWWNPATENQAIDRTHRIGQTHAVIVNRLVSAGTIEDKVMALKQRKAQLFNAVLDDDTGAFAQALAADDIRGLFE